MENIQLGIHHLSLDNLLDTSYLDTYIYPDMYKNYYWSEEFTAEYYIAQAKAGFIAVTDIYEEQELLLPEIQFSYALLDFRDLHSSKKVKRLIATKGLTLTIDNNIEEIAQYIELNHKNSWLTPKYAKMLRATDDIDPNFRVVTAYIESRDDIVAGEIGYVIGKTYTSLSGFSHKEKQYNSYGTAQLVLLGEYLKSQDFTLWNLGQPYMDYKITLGAKVYERDAFLERWFEGCRG